MFGRTIRPARIDPRVTRAIPLLVKRQRGREKAGTQPPARISGGWWERNSLGSASGFEAALPIHRLSTYREGGTACVPFQDKDHGMTMERRAMIFSSLRLSRNTAGRPLLTAAPGSAHEIYRSSGSDAVAGRRRHSWGSRPRASRRLSPTRSSFSASGFIGEWPVVVQNVGQDVLRLPLLIQMVEDIGHIGGRIRIGQHVAVRGLDGLVEGQAGLVELIPRKYTQPKVDKASGLLLLCS